MTSIILPLRGSFLVWWLFSDRHILSIELEVFLFFLTAFYGIYYSGGRWLQKDFPCSGSAGHLASPPFLSCTPCTELETTKSVLTTPYLTLKRQGHLFYYNKIYVFKLCNSRQNKHSRGKFGVAAGVVYTSGTFT